MVFSLKWGGSLTALDPLTSKRFVMLYIIVKYLHIVAAAIIVGVYSNQTLLSACKSKALTNGNYLNFYRFQLQFVAIPMLLIQFATGFYMARIARYSLGEPWISSTMSMIIGLIAASLFEIRFIQRNYRPTRFLSPISLFITLIAIFIMVTKPEF